jgi:hypothetical protein
MPDIGLGSIFAVWMKIGKLRIVAIAVKSVL